MLVGVHFAFERVSAREAGGSRDEVADGEHDVENRSVDLGVATVSAKACREQNDIDEDEHLLQSGVILQEELTQGQALVKRAACLASHFLHVTECAVKHLVLVVQLLPEVAKHQIRHRHIHGAWSLFVSHTVPVAVCRRSRTERVVQGREFENFSLRDALARSLTYGFVLGRVSLRGVRVKVWIRDKALGLQLFLQ